MKRLERRWLIEQGGPGHRGPELPAGTRSVAFRLTFRAPDRTLRDAEVDAVEKRMLAGLSGELGIQRRVGGAAGSGD